MKRRIKTIGWIVLALLILGGIGVWILLTRLPSITAQKLSKKLNGAVVTVSTATIHTGRLELNDVRIHLPDEPEGVRIKKMTLEGSMTQLYRGEPERVKLDRPRIRVKVEEDGQWNLQRLFKNGESGKGKTFPAIAMASGEIKLGKNPWEVESAPIQIETAEVEMREGKLGEIKIQGEIKRATIRGRKIDGVQIRMDTKGRKIAGTVSGGIEGGMARVDFLIDPEAKRGKVEGRAENISLEGIKSGTETMEEKEKRAGRVNGKVSVEIKSELDWGTDTIKMDGSVTLASQEGIERRESSLETGAITAEIPFTVEGKTNGGETELKLGEITAMAASLKLGWPVEFKKTIVKGRWDGKTVVATLQTEVLPTGQIELSIQGPLWPEPKLSFEAELKETDLARADSLVTDTALRGSLTATTAGKATWTWEEGKRFSINRDEPLQWVATGELKIARGGFSTKYEGGVEAEAIDGQISFSMEGINNRAKSLRLAENRPVSLKIGAARVGGKEILAGLNITNASGEFPMRGEEKLERATMSAGLSADRLIIADTIATGIRAPKIELNEGELKFGETTIEMISIGKDTSGEKIQIKELAATRDGEGTWQSTAKGSALTSLGSIQYGKLRLYEVTAKLAVASGVLRASDLRAKGFGAAFDGEATVNFLGEPVVELRGSVDNLNLHRFMQKEKIEAFDVDGPLQGTVRLKLHGVDWEDLHEDNLEVHLSATKAGQLYFAENDWIRDLKKKQPAMEKLLLEGGNQIAYETAEISLRRQAQDLTGEFSFRGPKVALTIPLTYQGGTLEKLVNRLKSLSGAKIKGEF